MLIGCKCRGVVCWKLLSFKCFSEYYMTLGTKERNFQKQPSVSLIVKEGTFNVLKLTCLNRKVGHLWDFTIYPSIMQPYKIIKMFQYLLNTNIIKQYAKSKGERRKKSRGGKEVKRNLEHSRNLLHWFSVYVCAPIPYHEQKLKLCRMQDAAHGPCASCSNGRYILITRSCPNQTVTSITVLPTETFQSSPFLLIHKE